jgi:hypothetical protein
MLCHTSYTENLRAAMAMLHLSIMTFVAYGFVADLANVEASVAAFFAKGLVATIAHVTFVAVFAKRFGAVFAAYEIRAAAVVTENHIVARATRVEAALAAADILATTVTVSPTVHAH